MINNFRIPLSLYIHIPWCARKCPYCDFNSHEGYLVAKESQYIHHLLQDFALDYAAETRPIQSIFIGGGTPSLFSAEGISQLLSGIHHIAPFSDDIEITLEANPGSVEQQKFEGYFASGINRLSLGIQSFQPQALQRIGRIHNSHEAHLAIKTAQAAGFSRINTDLMFALPEQNVAMAVEDLELAIAHGTEHLSWYQLTLEPNTPFYTHQPKLPNEDSQIDIYLAGCETLTSAGFTQYETSAWTRNQPCLHNLNYWQFGDYIGIGAGAHGKITLADGTIIRRSKYLSPNIYQLAKGKSENPYQDTQKSVQKTDQAFEFMMNALRLKAGVPINYLSERTNLSSEDIAPIWEMLQKAKLVNQDASRYQTTNRGFAMLNDVLEAFLP